MFGSGEGAARHPINESTNMIRFEATVVDYSSPTSLGTLVIANKEGIGLESIQIGLSICIEKRHHCPCMF